MFTNNTSIYHSYVDLLILHSIYKSYILFPQFMFYFYTLYILIYKFYITFIIFFSLLVIYQFNTLMLIYLFYLIFTSLIFHLHNLYYVLQRVESPWAEVVGLTNVWVANVPTFAESLLM